MATQSTEALARKAHALQARLSKQHARLIAAANQIARTRGRSGSSFSAGVKFGASIFGRPKQALRAKSSAGNVAFHFRMTPVTRNSAFTDMIAGRSAPKNGSGDDGASSKSEAHQIYIERLAAVETIELSKAAIKIDAGVIIDRSEFLIGPDHEEYAAAAAGYIDRDGAVETVASSFGNIADTIAERIAFWHAVEKSERRPAKHRATINPGLDTDFWNHVASDADAPPFLKKIAASNRDAIIVEQLREIDAKPIFEYFLAHRTATRDDAQTIAFEPGRGGRVQTRLVLELPADMTAEQRLETARLFCEKEFENNIRFHCAIHSPTKANDERNFHMHITFHDRPAERMVDPSTGNLAWDFEIIEKKRDSSRHYIPTRSFQQEKIRDFQDIKWPRKIRKDYAEIVNGVRKNHGMAPIYDHRSYEEIGIEVEALPSLTRQEFHDVQRGRENPAAADKIDKRWQRALYKAAEEILVGPDKDLTTRYRNLIQNVAKRAPASVVAAKIAHGAYLDAIRRINDARLDRAALKIAVEKEISGLFPEIGAAPPHAKKAKKEIEDLYQFLALPLYEQERLARESQQGAIQRLVMLEKQLKTMSLGSKSLPGYSFEQLAARAGLSATLVFPEAASNQITVPPTPPVAPKSPPTAAPATTIKQPAESGPVAAKPTPAATPAMPPITPPITPPIAPVHTSLNRTLTPQASVPNPTPVVVAPAIPTRIEAKPVPRRPIAPDIQTEAPAQVLPPIRMAPISSRRAEPIHATKTPLRPESPKAPAPIKAEPKAPAPVQPKAPLPKAPTSPGRPDSTHAIKTPLPTSVSKTDKIGDKSIQPVTAPTKPILPAVKPQTPASPRAAVRVTRTALPTSPAKAPPATLPTAAARSASNQALPSSSSAEKSFPKESSSAPTPKIPSSETGTPLSPVAPSASSIASQLSEEQLRNSKERREKRRAILATSRSRKPRDGHGR